MSSKARIPSGSPEERITAVAADLFYTQGYRATGVNELIERSGVAKATFYSHFPSKEDVAVAYLEQARQQELRYLDGCLSAETDPLGRYLSVAKSIGPWLIEHDYRGCPFINMASEMPDANERLRKIGIRMYNEAEALVQTLTQELIASDRKRYGQLDARRISKEYMVIVAGGLALAGVHRKLWPAEHALNAARRLVGA